MESDSEYLFGTYFMRNSMISLKVFIINAYDHYSILSFHSPFPIYVLRVRLQDQILVSTATYPPK
jgi:hypothetical protein